jgi:hypothetical protein
MFIALFGGLDRNEHRFMLALVRTAFFIIELDNPRVYCRPLTARRSTEHQACLPPHVERRRCLAS